MRRIFQSTSANTPPTFTTKNMGIFVHPTGVRRIFFVANLLWEIFWQRYFQNQDDHFIAIVNFWLITQFLQVKQDNSDVVSANLFSG